MVMSKSARSFGRDGEAEHQLTQNTGARIFRTTAGAADPLKAIETEPVARIGVNVIEM